MSGADSTRQVFASVIIIRRYIMHDLSSMSIDICRRYKKIVSLNFRLTHTELDNFIELQSECTIFYTLKEKKKLLTLLLLSSFLFNFFLVSDLKIGCCSQQKSYATFHHVSKLADADNFRAYSSNSFLSMYD